MATQDEMQQQQQQEREQRDQPRDIVDDWEETKELIRTVALPWEDELAEIPVVSTPATHRLNVLAETLWDAERGAQPARELRALLPELDIATAYAIRREVDLMRMIHGAAPVGRKIGLASRELLESAGADEPFWAYIFSTGQARNNATLDLRGLLRPRLEPEIAVVLGDDLDAPGVTNERARAAIATVHPAFEIVDTRTDVRGLDVPEVIADSGWNAGFVLGEAVPAAGLDLDAIRVRLVSAVNGPLREGEAATLLDGPVGCLAWLAEKLLAIGEPLRAGEIVLTGTLAGATPLKYGDTLTAEFTGFGPRTLKVTVSGL